MNIEEADTAVRVLNSEFWDKEMEHHGSATDRFELRSNGQDMAVHFLGHCLWSSTEDEREQDPAIKGELESLETFLRRESAADIRRLTGQPRL